MSDAEYDSTYQNNELVCVYEHGQAEPAAGSPDSQSTFGVPHRVVVSNFLYKVNETRKLQLLVRNPDNCHTTVGVKLYAIGAQNLTFKFHDLMQQNQLFGWKTI